MYNNGQIPDRLGCIDGVGGVYAIISQLATEPGLKNKNYSSVQPYSSYSSNHNYNQFNKTLQIVTS